MPHNLPWPWPCPVDEARVFQWVSNHCWQKDRCFCSSKESTAITHPSPFWDSIWNWKFNSQRRQRFLFISLYSSLNNMVPNVYAIDEQSYCILPAPKPGRDSNIRIAWTKIRGESLWKEWHLIWLLYFDAKSEVLGQEIQKPNSTP